MDDLTQQLQAELKNDMPVIWKISDVKSAYKAVKDVKVM